MSHTEARRELFHVMSKQMRALDDKPVYAWLASLLLAGASSACDPGVVRPLSLLVAAGATGSSESSADAGVDAGVLDASTAGRRSRPTLEPRGEAGTAGAPSACESDSDSEDALLLSLKNAVESGQFCPGLKRDLVPDPYLQQLAHNSLCAFPPVSVSQGWVPIPFFGRRTWTWATLAQNLEEAESALFAEDNTDLCESMRHTMYKTVGVAHVNDGWGVLIADPSPDEMQKP